MLIDEVASYLMGDSLCQDNTYSSSRYIHLMRHTKLDSFSPIRTNGNGRKPFCSIFHAIPSRTTKYPSLIGLNMNLKRLST